MQNSESSLSPEMLQEIRNEASELVEHLGTVCANFHLALQHDVEIARSEIDDLFRVLHTLKSVSQMAGLSTLMVLLHKVEDYIDLVRNGVHRFTGDDLDTLSDVQALLERAYLVYPAELSEDLCEEGARMGELFANKVTHPVGQELLLPGSPSDEGFHQGNNGKQADNDAQTGSHGNSHVHGAVESSSEDLAPRADEIAAFQKFQNRTESIFAVLLGSPTFADGQALLSSDVADSLSRVADIFYARVSPAGALLVFAADLDASILESIVGQSVIALEKSTSCLAVLGTPWSDSGFGAPVRESGPSAPRSRGSVTSNSSIAVSNVVPHEASNAVQAASNAAQAASNAAQAAPADVHHGHEASDGHSADDYQDFDTQNLGAQKSADLPDLDPEMLQDFLSNADELMESLNKSMLALEGNPTNAESIDVIFRAAHTIKGTAGMFGLRAIEKVTHVCENLFDRIRKGTLSVSPALMDGLFLAFDRIREMFEHLKRGESPEIPINSVLAILQSGAGHKSAQVTVGLQAARPSHALTQASGNHHESAAPLQSASDVSQASAGTGQNQPQQSETPSKANTPESKSVEGGMGTIRVDLRRLDSLVNLVGELVIDRTRFARVEEELRGRNANSELCHLMTESVLLFSRHMNEVQSIIMKVRMVPVGNAFHKFSRVVRDLSRQCGKEIELQIEGGETELDKTLVEEIGDPLVHLIRNSIDHGIEMPEDRIKKGKSPRGLIKLRAYQDGNMIVIEVQDDGKGLQLERIKAKGLQNGLLKETDHPSDKEIFNLIFEAGFSTADKVTNISGRGVGMDVVKRNIIKLKGIIELDSRLGEGTTTTIKLPLTLAIIPSLMVETMGESYAIPLVNVIESIRITPDQIHKIGSAEFVKLRDSVLPLLSLADVFELQNLDAKMWYRADSSAPTSLPASGTDHGSRKAPTLGSGGQSMRNRRSRPRLIFVVVGVGEKRVGIIVSQLLGQQEIVIKSLGQLLGKQKGVAGGCVLGNGRVALVLDIGEIIADFSLSKVEYSSVS